MSERTTFIVKLIQKESITNIVEKLKVPESEKKTMCFDSSKSSALKGNADYGTYSVICYDINLYLDSQKYYFFMDFYLEKGEDKTCNFFELFIYSWNVEHLLKDNEAWTEQVKKNLECTFPRCEVVLEFETSDFYQEPELLFFEHIAQSR